MERYNDPKNQRAGYMVKQQSNYASSVPKPLPPKDMVLTAKTIKLLAEANLNLGRLDGLSVSLPGKDTFISMYVQKEAVLSSQIEGTQASFVDVLQENESKRLDVQEIVSYTKALNFGIKRLESLPMSLRLIRELHAILMDNTRGNDKNPGDFRKTQNWIGALGSTLSSARFVPPNVADMKHCLYDLESFMHSQDDIPALVKIALIHYQFETIHPFLDGNGRMGRLLIGLWLYSEDILEIPLLYLSYYFKKYRDQYYEILMKVRIEGDFEGWIDFFLDAVNKMSIESIRSINKILELRELDFQKISTFKLQNHTLALMVLNYLYNKPIVQSMELVEHLGVSKPTVNKLLSEFVKNGILSLDSNKKRYRQYQYQSYIDILQEGTEI